jgi:hypothetical protein
MLIGAADVVKAEGTPRYVVLSRGLSLWRGGRHFSWHSLPHTHTNDVSDG